MIQSLKSGLSRHALSGSWIPKFSLSIIFLFAGFLKSEAVVSITGANDVVYDVVDETEHTVVVSAYNSSVFKDRADVLVIPKKVTDTATTSSDHETEYSVIGIVAQAFRGTSITSITFEAEIPEIPTRAFYQCYGLKTVVFPSSVTAIGEEAFYYDNTLESITSTAGVKTIENNAFYQCSNLKTIEFAEGLTSIGERAFYYCSALNNLTFPSTLPEIKTECFYYCTSLSGITIPEEMTLINERAFYGCSSLESPVFHEGLELARNSFYNCTNLNELTLYKDMILRESCFEKCGVTKIFWPESPMTIEPSIFKAVTKLETVTFPLWMTAVPQSIFFQCLSLKEIVLHSGITEICTGAFSLNGVYTTDTNFTKISFREGHENNLTTIGSTAFYRRMALTSFPFRSGMTLEREALAATGITDIVLVPDMTVNEDALNVAKINSITWPDKPLKVNGPAFGTARSDLQTMTFPAWMDTIPERICHSWKELRTVTIQQGTKVIGDNAFFTCRYLYTVNLPEGLEEIGSGVFGGSSTTVNYRVGYLTSIKLPSTLKKIGSGAFQRSGLHNSIYLPESLEELGGNAFAYTNVSSVLMAYTKLTSIPSRAFQNCEYLNTIYWPTNITEVGDNAFEGTAVYSSYTQNPDYVNGTDSHPYKKMDCMLPPSVKKVGNHAFSTTKHKSFKFNSIDLTNVEEVGNYASAGVFFDDIIWPEKEISLGTYIFKDCTQTHKVKFPDWMTVIPEGIFLGATFLHDIDFNKVEEISANAFKGCTNLAQLNCTYTVCQTAAGDASNEEQTSEEEDAGAEADTETDNIFTLRFPSTLNIIGSQAFESTGTSNDPYRLELPDGVEIGDMAFSKANISEVTFAGCGTFSKRMFEGTSISKVVIPKCMTEIPEGFLSGMTSLTDVEIHSDVTKIGKSAFQGCSGLTGITFPEALEVIDDDAFKNTGITSIPWDDLKNMKTIGTGVFSGTKVQSLTIPSWVTKIPENCFYNCTELETVKMRNAELSNLERVDANAFSSCTKLTSVTLPDKVTTLGGYAFNNCKLLETITCNGVEEIGERCFQYSYALKSPIPPKVKSLGEYAYYYSGITDVTLNDELELIPERCFQNSKVQNLKLGSGIKEIAGYAFSGCHDLKDFDFPDGFETIGNWAFENTYALTKIEFPSTLKYVGRYAFSGDNTESSVVKIEDKQSKLDYANSHIETVVNHSPDVVFEDNIFAGQKRLKSYHSDYPMLYVPNSFFNTCLSLETFELPAGTKLLGVKSYAFSNCISLKSFPYTVTAGIGNYAFFNCQFKQMTLATGEDFPYSGDLTNDLSEYYNTKNDDEEGNHHNPGIYFNQNYSYSSYYYPLYECRSLQSITIPYKGKEVRFQEYDFYGAPLRGVSYCYAEDIVPYSYPMPSEFSGQRVNSTIQSDYYISTWGYDGVVDNQESILMVPRGEKWKYVNSHYDRRFNIIEMKNPSPEMEGDIFCDYNREENRNHYKVHLRWGIELSDLNENGDTQFEIFRGDEKLADIILEKPREIAGADAPDGALSQERVIMVPIKINPVSENSTLHREFKGDYEYPVQIRDWQTSTTKDLWVLEYNLQEKNLYFDVDTHRRLSAFEHYGYKSWYTIVDEFDGPELTSLDIPDKYEYTVKMKGYPYQEYVNNLDFEPGEDGHLYHLETRTLPAEMTFDKCVVRPSIGSVTLDFPGLYSEKDVRNDVAAGLETSLAHKERTDGTEVVNDLDADLLSEQVFVRAYSSASHPNYDRRLNNRISGVVTYKLDDDRTTLTEYDPGLTVVTDRHPVEQSQLKPGDRIQSVYTLYERGTIASPVVTLPDVPVLTATLEEGFTNHTKENADDHIIKAAKVTVTLKADVGAAGYTSLLPEDSNNWKLGVWRKKEVFSTTPADPTPDPDPNPDAGDENGQEGGNDDEPTPESAKRRAAALFDATENDLLHHWGGAVGNDSECGICNSEKNSDFITVDNETGQIQYVDVFDTDSQGSYGAAYENRLYVKVPKTMLRTPEDKWMLVASPIATANATTFISTVSSDDLNQEGDARWYDIQGLPVENPQKGNFYIRVTSKGSEKVRY